MLGKVYLAAPWSSDVAAVVGTHSPVEGFVGEGVSVVGSQSQIVCRIAPVDRNRIALGSNLDFVVFCLTGSLPGKGRSHNHRAFSWTDRHGGRWLGRYRGDL